MLTFNRRLFSAMALALGLAATPAMAADVEVRFTTQWPWVVL